MSGNDIRWCDQGCGYKLPPEYAPDETTCGACLDNPIGCCEMATDTEEVERFVEEFYKTENRLPTSDEVAKFRENASKS